MNRITQWGCEMYLAYFDENKYSIENPYFFIGGYLVAEDQARELENTLTRIQSNFFGSAALRTDTEFHGKEMFHGKVISKDES